MMAAGNTGKSSTDHVGRDALTIALPALAVGLLLRIVFMWKLPLGLVYQDSFDFLQTAEAWIWKGEYALQAKKTFLVPTLYLVPFLLKLPALVFIPVAQHALGLVSIYLSSVLCRCWFSHWRVIGTVATLLVAINPHIVWFEHVLMAESIYVATSLFLAVAASLYAMRPSWLRFGLFLAAAALQAGTRPEGRLFLGLGLLMLPMIHWKNLGSLGLRGAIYAGFALAMLAVTKTSQSGLLLLTAMLPMTPAEIRSAPGLAPLLAPIREDLAAASSVRPYFPNAGFRKRIERAARQSLSERTGTPPDEIDREAAMRLCSKAGKEILLRNGWLLPGYAVAKFRFSQASGPSYAPDERYLHEKPLDAFGDSRKTLGRLKGGLIPGIPNDMEKIRAEILAVQRPEKMKWFDAWQDAWCAGVMAVRLPDAIYADGGRDRGIPWLHLAALAGVLGLMVGGRLPAVHLPWGLLIVGMFFLIVTVASPRPRFSFVFEPFYTLYAAAALDLAVSAVAGLWRRRP
jgi:hypothetical protein